MVANDHLREELKKRFEYIKERESVDWVSVEVPRDRMIDFSRVIKGEMGFDLLVDISGVDWGVGAERRFGVVYHFYSSGRRVYLRVLVNCEDNEKPEVVTLSNLWGGANWHEREAYDMYGIRFKGHPELKRILMWEGYEHYPLRKDFPLAGVEGEFPARDVGEEYGVGVEAAPMAGGPFHAVSGNRVSRREPEGRDESWNEGRMKPKA